MAFLFAPDLGAGRRGCGHPRQQRQAEAQASASAYRQAVDRVGCGAVRSCRAGRQREHERHRRFRLAVRRRDARGGRRRGHREDHRGWRLRESVLAQPDRLGAADRQGLRRLPLRGRRQRHRRGQPLSQPVQRLCGPVRARVGLGVQRQRSLGQRRLGAPVGQPSVFAYQGLAHRVRAGFRRVPDSVRRARPLHAVEGSVRFHERDRLAVHSVERRQQGRGHGAVCVHRLSERCRPVGFEPVLR